MTASKIVLVSTPMFGRYSEEARSQLEEYGCELIELSREEAADREILSEFLPDVSAWIVGYTEVGEKTFERASNLEVIAKHGTGVDNIDLESARDQDVVVSNAPGANANAVAELVLLHMLNFGRNLVEGHLAVRRRRWNADVGTELSGKTLGIVGLGKIGRTLVRRTQGFDVDYVAYDLEERPAFRGRYGVRMADGLEDLLEIADFVTLHVPLNEHTRHLIGRGELTAMKSSACLINTARGGVVDEDALVDALEEDEIEGAALDVLESEPPDDSPRYDTLLADDRVTLSPHIGGKTEEAMGAISEVTARNVLNVFKGKEPLHRVV